MSNVRPHVKPSEPVSETELKADADEFHSSYRVFVNALEMLAASPGEQCQLMGNYNVAWELKDDVSAGQYLVGQGYLSREQEAWVGALVSALAAVDTLVPPAGSEKEANLLAMEHPSWEPMRFLAREVIHRLTSFTAENAKYLGLAPKISVHSANSAAREKMTAGIESIERLARENAK